MLVCGSAFGAVSFSGGAISQDQSIIPADEPGRDRGVADLLGHVEQQFWAGDLVIHLDNMNIWRDAQDPSAQRITLKELHNARGASLVMLLVALAPGELPQRENVISAAERYLI